MAEFIFSSLRGHQLSHSFSRAFRRSTFAVAMMAPATVLADPTASINLSWVFGEGFAIGVKAFSNDKSGEAAATIGLDYLFAAQELRPNIGVAYLDDDYFVGIGIGVLNSDWSSVNFGIDVGPLDGDDGRPAGAAGAGSDATDAAPASDPASPEPVDDIPTDAI